MKIRLNRTFGEIEIEQGNAKDLIQEVAFWQTLPNNCPTCGAELTLFYRNPKDNSYYGLACKGKVKHESNFGQHKVGGGLYYKNEWHEAFGSYQEERDAEIGKYDTPSEYAPRIANARRAILDLGGKIEPQGRNESEKDYLDSLNAQYKRLKQ